MHSKLFRRMVLLAMSIFVLSGCRQNAVGDGKTSVNASVSTKKLTIVTSFYPMYVSTINVTKDVSGVEVVNMTKPQTGCLHDYQLTPSDLKTLETADAFVVNGAGMEAFLDKVVNQQKDLQIIDASKGIELIKDDDGEENPHVWVSVSNAILQVKNIQEQLSAIDKGNADKYKSNADAYIKKFEALKSKMHEALDGVKNREIITFHEAFPYFAKEFNFKIVAVIEREPDTSPTPQELTDTIEIVKNSGIKALFAEPQYPAKAAETIAKETGAKVYSLDPAVTGDADLDAYDEYINTMEQNLKSLQEALK